MVSGTSQQNASGSEIVVLISNAVVKKDHQASFSSLKCNKRKSALSRANNGRKHKHSRQAHKMVYFMKTLLRVLH
jgi:hypothetical protein